MCIRERSGAGRLKQLKATYHSINGLFESYWKKEADGVLVVHVKVPVNTTAEVYVPARSAEGITVDGKKVAAVSEISVKGRAGDRVILAVGSGHYEFRSQP